MNLPPSVCDLCGLPLLDSPISIDTETRQFRFCCIGCKQVFMMLMEASDSPDPNSFKDTPLFQKCLELGIIPKTESDLKKIDEASKRSLPNGSNRNRSERAAEGLELSVKVQGMWCPACSWVIEETLKKIPGILNVSCNFSTDRLKCDYDPVCVAPDQIVKRIEALGYESNVSDSDSEPAGTRIELIRLLISAFLTMNIMMLSYALYSGFFTHLTHESILKLSWPPFIMATVVICYGGRRIFQRAAQGFRSVSFGMESLIAVSSLSAYGYSMVNLLSGSGSIHLYFDTASMLITLTLLGKMLERRAKDRVQATFESFFELMPTKVRICTDRIPTGRYVSSLRLKKNDMFRVISDETVPADGLIINGEGIIDESSLTGEAEPVRIKTGDRIKSGTRLVRGDIKARAEGIGKDSTLGQMIQIMEKALSEKSTLEGRTDQILQYFVPGIILLAIGTGIVLFLIKGSFEIAMIRSVTVMVISCPCALGIAIPLARVAGISVAGEKGILVRDFAAFEQSELVDTVVFDKTGTVTVGRWTLLRVHAISPHSENRMLSIAAVLERASDHYIAVEIKRAAQSLGTLDPSDIRFDNIKIEENGISGFIDHQPVKIGSKAFLKMSLSPSGDLPELKKGESAVYMSIDKTLSAVFVFGDRIREGVPEMIQKLHETGFKTALISGDGEETTRAIGKAIGIHESLGSRLPRGKSAFIETLQHDGRTVAMVGDGINDAPALVQADLSFAVHSGSHLGKDAANVILLRGNPVQLLDYLSLVKAVNRKVLQNLLGALIYNAIGVPVAVLGLLSPLVAATAMFMSSLTVTGNTLLFIRKYSK